MKKNTSNMSDIKIENINSIFELIRRNNDISRVKLSQLSNLTKMSIGRIVSLLIDNNLVYEKGEILNGRGRPAKKLYINENVLYSLAIYLDVEEIKLAIINLKNNFIYEKSIDAKKISTMEEYVDSIYKDIKTIDKDIFTKVEVLSFICPGIINPNNGEVAVSAQLKWKHERLGDYASQVFGKKVLVINDVKAALKGEIADLSNMESLNLAYMNIGFGVGVGIISNGNIIYGANNNAGEIGHITIDYKGKLCECGRRGCLNTVLNIESILEYAKLKDKSIKSIEDLLTSYESGQAWTRDLIENISTYLSIALNNIIYAYDPEEIILGGKFFEDFEKFSNVILDSKNFIMHKHYWSDVRIRISDKKDKTYLLGGGIDAQKLSLNRIFE